MTSGWEPSENGSESHDPLERGLLLEASDDDEYGGWCEKCFVGVECWNQPQFCCLRVAKTSLSGPTNRMPPPPPDGIFFIVLRRSDIVPGAWEKIGVGEVEPDEDFFQYELQSATQKLRLI
jgi:hypothetical protein